MLVLHLRVHNTHASSVRRLSLFSNLHLHLLGVVGPSKPVGGWIPLLLPLSRRQESECMKERVVTGATKEVNGGGRREIRRGLF